MSSENRFKEKLLNYLYILSKQPILLRDLLDANRQFNEGMHVDPSKLGFRLRLARAYVVYITLVMLLLTPLSTFMHTALANVDSHISILLAMLITALIFIGFNFFRAKMRDVITARQIKKSWALRFPYFPYEEYRYKIEKIYQDAIKEEIPKKDLEKFILDKLVQD